jgi:hypothetical protein
MIQVFAFSLPSRLFIDGGREMPPSHRASNSGCNLFDGGLAGQAL